MYIPLMPMLASLFKLPYRRYFRTPTRYAGTAREICEQIIEHTWNGTYYQTSLGHYDYFFVRDFGTVCASLTQTGSSERVRQTLAWALHAYQRAGHVTLCIDRKGRAFNVPDRAIDSLPWLMHCLAITDYPLTPGDRAFLSNELRRYTHTYLDPHTMLPRPVHYIELRDTVKYHMSSYSIALIARLCVCTDILGIQSTLPGSDYYLDYLNTHYWTGEYYARDYGSHAFSGEGALMPFFLGVVTDARRVKATHHYIVRNELNRPLALHFTANHHGFRPYVRAQFVMPNYAGTTVWTWLGGFYLHVLKEYGLDYKEDLANMMEMVERYGTFPELLNPDGSWYKTWFYSTDDGMIWCALLSSLIAQRPSDSR